VAELRNVTEIPGSAQYYRDRTAPESEGHILSFHDELQTADNLAFLSHWAEGVDQVSAITRLAIHSISIHAASSTVLIEKIQFYASRPPQPF
jgi:hypothetical protein